MLRAGFRVSSQPRGRAHIAGPSFYEVDRRKRQWQFRSRREYPLSESPKQAAAAAPDEDRAGALGLHLAALSPELRRQYRVPKDIDGVVVTEVADQSPADSAGIQPGDVLVSVDQKPVETPQKAAEQLKEAAARGNILLLINRKGSSQFVGLSINRSSGTGKPG